MQVYRYYRDLINFKSRGDPAMMLRCINPMEAKLLDAAAGIHIKFRLAGVRFLVWGLAQKTDPLICYIFWVSVHSVLFTIDKHVSVKDSRATCHSVKYFSQFSSTIYAKH